MVGIEPTTYGLRNRCSTTELHWHQGSRTTLSSALILFSNSGKEAIATPASTQEIAMSMGRWRALYQPARLSERGSDSDVGVGGAKRFGKLSLCMRRELMPSDMSGIFIAMRQSGTAFPGVMFGHMPPISRMVD